MSLKPKKLQTQRRWTFQNLVIWCPACAPISTSCFSSPLAPVRDLRVDSDGWIGSAPLPCWIFLPDVLLSISSSPLLSLRAHYAAEQSQRRHVWVSHGSEAPSSASNPPCSTMTREDSQRKTAGPNYQNKTRWWRAARYTLSVCLDYMEIHILLNRCLVFH